MLLHLSRCIDEVACADVNAIQSIVQMLKMGHHN
jgi:hypothetical protein